MLLLLSVVHHFPFLHCLLLGSKVSKLVIIKLNISNKQKTLWALPTSPLNIQARTHEKKRTVYSQFLRLIEHLLPKQKSTTRLNITNNVCYYCSFSCPRKMRSTTRSNFRTNVASVITVPSQFEQ